jgi:hypothetical protein
MASVASEATAASLRGSASADAHDADDAVIAAWICAIPCAVLAAVAILVLGPPLGQLLYPAQNPFTFLAGVAAVANPEPTETARYVVAACAPLLGTLAIALTPRWIARVPERWIAPAVLGTQLALAGLVAALIVNQYHIKFVSFYAVGLVLERTTRYFTPATLLVAALLAVATVGVLRQGRLRAHAAALVLGETRTRRLVAGGLALAATVVWMSHAVHTDAELGNASHDLRHHLAFQLDETFAVLNGHTPLVDFFPIYAALWPFVIATAMLVFGKTVLTFTLVACTLTGVGLLAVYGVLRRAAGSAAAALLLYLPVLATSMFLVAGPLQNRETVGTFYGTFPMRYAGPLLLAWLTARHLERRDQRFVATWLLLTFAGLVLVNNVELGVAALGATLAALLWGAPPRARLGRGALLRLAGALAAGLATAFSLYALLTLARAGSLPHPGQLVENARTYAQGGYNMIPIPSVFGVNMLVYLTYVAAIALATARARRGAHGRVLTGMLAWAAVFGLGAGMYYIGRSHPDTLRHEFPAWAFALALLTISAVRELSAPRLRPRNSAIGAFIVLFGFGVCACSLAQTPTPWGQLERLQAPFAPTVESPDANPLMAPTQASARRFVATLADGRSRFVYKRGAPIAILLPTGHRVADAYGVVDVDPTTGAQPLLTVEQLDAALDALREAGGNTVILPDPLDPSVLSLMGRRGFELLTQRGLAPIVPGRTPPPLEIVWPGETGIMKLVDARHLHPRALR